MACVGRIRKGQGIGNPVWLIPHLDIMHLADPVVVIVLVKAFHITDIVIPFVLGIRKHRTPTNLGIVFDVRVQRVMVTEIIGIIVTQLDSLIFIIADMGHKALLVFPIVQPVDPAVAAIDVLSLEVDLDPIGYDLVIGVDDHMIGLTSRHGGCSTAGSALRMPLV